MMMMMIMIDITCVRKAYEKKEISVVGFVRTQHNPADAFTRTSKCDAFHSVTRTRTFDLHIEQ